MVPQMPDSLRCSVELVVPVQRGVVPGDAAVFTCDGVNDDVPLAQPCPNAALEHEAFTGRSNAEATGWICKGQRKFLTSLIEYSQMVGVEHPQRWS